MKPVSSEIMAEIDRKAREDYSLSQLVLMENAGRTSSELILTDIEPIKDKKIAVFCGKGNNGGDGFVAARYFANKSPLKLTVYVLDPLSIKEGAARDNFGIIRKMKIDVKSLEDFLRSEETDFSVHVDAVFGTGFKGELPKEYASLGEKLNSSGVKLYALDVPSGLDATTGLAAKNSFKAYKTITFGLPKEGFYRGDGPDLCGEIVVKDIGFPRELLEEYL